MSCTVADKITQPYPAWCDTQPKPVGALCIMGMTYKEISQKLPLSFTTLLPDLRKIAESGCIIQSGEREERKEILWEPTRLHWSIECQNN